MKILNDPRVDKEIRALPKLDGANVVRVVDMFTEYGFALTEQHLKKLGKNLWELRAGQIRLLLGLVEKSAIIVNIFLKKSQKTHKKEIELAIKRLKEYL